MYHAGIELVNGQPEILLGRWFTAIGAHCKGYNDKSIGICIVGNFDDPAQVDAMLEDGRFMAAVRLTNWCKDLFNIPPVNVHPHRRFADKSCPGRMFPWDRFVHAIGGA